MKLAKKISKANPELANALIKAAQTYDPNMMNPNIQPFVQPPAQKTEMHKITLSIEVPENTNEMEILSAILPGSQQLENKGYKLKGYSFDERSRG